MDATPAQGRVIPRMWFPQIASQAKIQSVVQQQIRTNVDLIKSIPQQYFDRIASDIYDNIIAAQRWEVLADTLIDTLVDDFSITQSRANLIARDQTSKMNAAFTEERQTSVGITSYQWQTAGDERVRPTHEANDGQIFEWDNPPEETGHPGHDVNCRCVALAQFEELGEES
jgi:SPP1 gp7 family putative phage head morphogenesis protein